MKKIRNFLLYSFLVLLAASALSSAGFIPVEKRADAFSGVFGGRIGAVIFCSCSGWTWFSVGLPRPGQLILTSYSTPPFYEYRRIAPGVWTLGTYLGLTVCRTPPPLCPVVAVGNIVELMGTSL